MSRSSRRSFLPEMELTGRAVLVSTSIVVSVTPGQIHNPSVVVVPSIKVVVVVELPSVVVVVDVEGQIQTVVKAGVVVVVVVVDSTACLFILILGVLSLFASSISMATSSG